MSGCSGTGCLGRRPARTELVQGAACSLAPLRRATPAATATARARRAALWVRLRGGQQRSW
eukprot:493058-Alexandrium_andersonii.AAC.1